MAALVIVVGSFLPWVNTAFGTYSGFDGAGVWTFYAGVFGIAGALISSRRAALVQAVVVGVVTVALTGWQIVHLLSLGVSGGWLPGVGLLMVLGGGLLALRAAWRLSHPA